MSRLALAFALFASVTFTFASLDTGTAIPPLASITLGMPTQNPLPVSSTYTPGATPPNSGAPVLPTPCKFVVVTKTNVIA